MPAEDPRAVIRRWVEAWNAQDLDAAEELLAPEFVRHDANLPDVVGPQVESYRLADGKLAEQWVVMDALGLLQQLGAVPGPG
jgi:ketosteroid isomerase-like protein